MDNEKSPRLVKTVSPTTATMSGSAIPVAEVISNEAKLSEDTPNSNSGDEDQEGPTCVSAYPEGYQIRCSCLEVGMETFDCDIQAIYLDFWNSGFNDKCAKMQLCCLGCVFDTNVCGYFRCGEKDCMCDPPPGTTQFAVQCCCFHTGFFCNDCFKYDCCRLRLCCVKVELDRNVTSCQLCCAKCGDTEESVLPQTLRPSKLRSWSSS